VEGYKGGYNTATDCNVSATAKFQDALTEHQQSAQRHLNLAKGDNNYCCSSDDDDVDDDEANDKDVFKTLVKSFNLPSGALLMFSIVIIHLLDLLVIW